MCVGRERDVELRKVDARRATKNTLGTNACLFFSLDDNNQDTRAFILHT